MSDHQYLTTKEFASRFGVTEQAIRKAIQEGRIVAERFGKVFMVPKDAQYSPKARSK